MAASTYLSDKLLDDVFGNTAYSVPTTMWCALYTSSPGIGGSANTNEATGTGYARVSITNNTTNWPNASAQAKANGTQISFPTPGAGGWGTVTYVAIVDSASGVGNVLVFGALTIAKTINQNDTVVIDATTGLSLTLT